MKYILINQCKSMEILFSQNDSKEKKRGHNLRKRFFLGTFW